MGDSFSFFNSFVLKLYSGESSRWQNTRYSNFPLKIPKKSKVQNLEFENVELEFFHNVFLCIQIAKGQFPDKKTKVEKHEKEPSPI